MERRVQVRVRQPDRRKRGTWSTLILTGVQNIKDGKRYWSSLQTLVQILRHLQRRRGIQFSQQHYISRVDRWSSSTAHRQTYLQPWPGVANHESRRRNSFSHKPVDMDDNKENVPPEEAHSPPICRFTLVRGSGIRTPLGSIITRDNGCGSREYACALKLEEIDKLR